MKKRCKIFYIMNIAVDSNYFGHCTIVGTNLCVPRPLEAKGKGIREVEKGYQTRKHILSILKTLFPSVSAL
jgi:hypothetical protein